MMTTAAAQTSRPEESRFSPAGRKLFELRRAAYYSPLDFFRVWLRFPYLYTWQKDFLGQVGERIRGGQRKIKAVVRTCHGAGKTLTAAGLMQAFMYTRQEPRVLTLAQSWVGIETLIWAEVGRQWTRSLQGDLGWGKLTGTKLQLSKGSFAFGMSTDRPGRLEGQHSPFAAMRIVDEAKEVDDKSFEATEGLLDAPESWDVWISTPSIPSGKFYERDSRADSDTIRVRVTIEDLIEDYERFGYPSLAGKRAWRDAMLVEWGGEDDPRYQSRAMANYVDNVEGALFPLSWVERAFATDFGDPRRPSGAYLGAARVGMDVAGSVDGDANTTAPVQYLEDGRLQAVATIREWAERDTMISKDKAQRHARELAIGKLRIDVNGLGQGVADQARREGGLEIEGYRSTEKARKSEDFSNRKAEDGWHLRKLLEDGKVDLSRIVEPARSKLRKQMAAMRYQELESGAKRVVDPADSPDLAEALIIAAAPERKSFAGMARIRGIG